MHLGSNMELGFEHPALPGIPPERLLLTPTQRQAGYRMRNPEGYSLPTQLTDRASPDGVVVNCRQSAIRRESGWPNADCSGGPSERSVINPGQLERLRQVERSDRSIELRL